MASPISTPLMAGQHDGLGKATVQFSIPLSMGSETEWDSFHSNFQHAPECVSVGGRLVDQFDKLGVIFGA